MEEYDLILLYRISHAASFIVIFPFITDMTTSFNVPQDRIGLYAGIGEGALMLTETMAAPVWAMISDRCGRRPTMVWSFCLSIGPACLVGFSTRPWHVVVLRGMFGMLSSQGITQTILTEISNPKNRVRLFAISGPTWHVGAMIGNMLSGALTRPHGRLPVWLGGRLELFRVWPYAFPCLAVGGLGVIASVIGIVMLEESKKALVAPQEVDDRRPVQRPRNKYLETLRVPHFLLMVVSFCSIQLMCMAFDGVYSVYTYTSTNKGGLGLPVDKIGIAMFCGNLAFILTVPTVLPVLIDRCGLVNSQQGLILLWPLVGLSLPLCNWIAKEAHSFMWPFIALQQLAKAVGGFVWVLSHMMTMGSFDDAPHLLATGSAITLVGGATGRAVGPALAGWVFSLSTQFETGSLGRQAYWITYIGLTIPPVILLRYLPKNHSVEREGYASVPEEEEA